MTSELNKALDSIYNLNCGTMQASAFMLLMFFALFTMLMIVACIILTLQKEQTPIYVKGIFGLLTIGAISVGSSIPSQIATTRDQVKNYYLTTLHGNFDVDTAFSDGKETYFKILPESKKAETKHILSKTVVVTTEKPYFLITEDQAKDLQEAMLASDDSQLRKNAQTLAIK